MDCTIYVAKTKALISFAVTAKLICVFVFAYAKSRFSHDAAHLLAVVKKKIALMLLLMECTRKRVTVVKATYKPNLEKRCCSKLKTSEAQYCRRYKAV